MTSPVSSATATLDPAVSPVRAEAPYTLDEPAPRVLSAWDQVGLWANLGVSLLGPVGAIYVLQPPGFPRLSFVAAFVAVVVGTLLGTLLVALATVPGAQTGAPSMVLLRGLLGHRASYLPTAFNITQLIGWGVFEIVVITEAARQLSPWPDSRWPYVVAAGVLTTLMTIWPLGSVRVLRRYALVAVTIATVYLFVELLRNPLPSLTDGSWSGFWLACDFVIAVAVSWVPLASDYSRHSRSTRTAFGAAFVGYSVTQIAYYTLGLLALATVVQAGDPDLQTHMFAAFIAVPLGWLAVAVLVTRELDQCFADAYSTVVSTQNLFPRVDRRIFAVVVGIVTTVLALALTIADYTNFLTALGSVFVPLFAVFVVEYFVLRRGAVWDTTVSARTRWSALVCWAIGFVVYQLVYSPAAWGWDDMWADIRDTVHFTWHSWMSASVLSFAAAASATLLLAGLRRLKT